MFSPVFDGLYDFCSIYTGASLEGAIKLNHNVGRATQLPLLTAFSNVMLLSTGLVGYTMLRNSKHQASAMSMTSSLPSRSF